MQLEVEMIKMKTIIKAYLVDHMYTTMKEVEKLFSLQMMQKLVTWKLGAFWSGNISKPDLFDFWISSLTEGKREWVPWRDFYFDELIGELSSWT